MKLVKIIPKSLTAWKRIVEHGAEMEFLFEEKDKIIVRSLEKTFKYKDNTMSRWVGTFTKEEAEWVILD